MSPFQSEYNRKFETERINVRELSMEESQPNFYEEEDVPKDQLTDRSSLMSE